jgi:hypothetical protein
MHITPGRPPDPLGASDALIPGVGKVVPADDGVLERHARRVITRTLLNSRRLNAMRGTVEAEAAAIALPEDLRRKVVEALKRRPDIPWDLAVADIARCTP